MVLYGYYMMVNGKDDIPYMKWNITFMFQTTNQNRSPISPYMIYDSWHINDPTFK
jgi:hypothetical protein